MQEQPGQQTQQDPSSSSDEFDGESVDSSDEEAEGQNTRTFSQIVMPQVMPEQDESSSSGGSDAEADEATAKGFLANTMGLMVTSKDAGKDSIRADKSNKNSKIANDLDALFGKLV